MSTLVLITSCWLHRNLHAYSITLIIAWSASFRQVLSSLLVICCRYNFLARKQSLVFFLIIQMVPTMAAWLPSSAMAPMLNAPTIAGSSSSWSAGNPCECLVNERLLWHQKANAPDESGQNWMVQDTSAAFLANRSPLVRPMVATLPLGPSWGLRDHPL